MNNVDEIIDSFRTHVSPLLGGDHAFDIPTIMVECLLSTTPRSIEYSLQELIKEAIAVNNIKYFVPIIEMYDRLIDIGATGNQYYEYNDLDCNAWAYPEVIGEKQTLGKDTWFVDIQRKWVHVCQNFAIGYCIEYPRFNDEYNGNFHVTMHLINRHNQFPYTTSKEDIDRWSQDVNNYNTKIIEVRSTIRNDEDRITNSVWYERIIGLQTAGLNVESLDCALNEKAGELHEFTPPNRDCEIDQLEEHIRELQSKLNHLKELDNPT